MGAQKIEHSAVCRRLVGGRAQGLGRQTCERYEALGARCVRKDPGEGPKRDGRGIVNRIFRPIKNCQPSVKEIMGRYKLPWGRKQSGAQ